MLVTRAADGGLHERPLTLAEAQHDGKVYFSTSIESPKVAELFRSLEAFATGTKASDGTDDRQNAKVLL